MWQRIQTIYLALAAVLILLLFAFPLIKAKRIGDTGAEPQYASVYVYGVKDDVSGASLATFYVAPAIALLLVAFMVFIILQFKNRALQIIAGRFALLVSTALLVLLMNTVAAETPLEQTLDKHYTIGIFLLLPVLVFIILALKAIRNDEALVRAADRIR